MRTIGRPLYRTIGRVIGKGAHLGSKLNYLKWFNNYKTRVENDSGTLTNETFAINLLKNLEKNNLYTNTKVLFSPNLGVKTRQSGLLTFVEKGYNLARDSTNDLIQSTTGSQPYISGNIAPNEKLKIKNNNSENRFLAFSTVSFSATEKWSIAIRIRRMGSLESLEFFISTLFGRGFLIVADKVANREYTSGDYAIFNNTSFKALIGSFKTIHLIVSTPGNIDFYLDSIFLGTLTTETKADFYEIMRYSGSIGSNFPGYISYFRLQSGSMSESEIESEVAYLNSEIKEIDYTVIGTKYFSSSNYDAIRSHASAIITKAADNTDWATGAARWDYCGADVNKHYFGLVYNKASRDIFVANPPEGWHVATEAELTVLAENGGNSLKVTGTDYWTTATGTNTTGFSAIGGGSRNADGTWNTEKGTVSFWCADSDKVLKLTDNSDVAEIVASTANEGHYIRLVNNLTFPIPLA